MRLFVGNGIGPLILASVAVAASTILSHAACMCDVSKDFNRILIFDAATGAAAAVGEEKRRPLSVFDIEKRRRRRHRRRENAPRVIEFVQRRGIPRRHDVWT